MLLFNHIHDDFIMVSRNDESKQFLFEHFQSKCKSSFQNLTIDVSRFDMRGFEIKEVSILKTGIARIIGVRFAE